MSRRTLFRLLIALAVMAAIVGLLSLQGSRDRSANAVLFPDLKDSLNDVSRIQITGASGITLVTLVRDAEQWTVAERDNYPADLGLIRQNLLALAGARIAEVKTSSPELYSRLGVEDVTGAAATGLGLALTGGKAPVNVIIGLTQPGSADLTYVREVGQATSLLVKARFDLGRTADAWIDKRLVSVPLERIASVTVVNPGEPPLTLVRPAEDGTEFTLQDLPPRGELRYPGVGTAVAAALTDLRLEAVDQRDVLGADPGKPVVARFETLDGLVIETSAWRLPEGTKFTFLASAVTEAAQAEADTVNARLGGWVYTLRDFAAEQLTVRLQDLLAPG